MRLAVVLVAVHERRSLEAALLDVERLQQLATEHELEIFVDQATAGSERLRQAGLAVTVSVKRDVVGSRGDRLSADALQARAIRQSHDRSPFDAIVYGSDVPVDLAWFEPRLRELPRGVALGAGLAHDLRLVWEDRRLFARVGRYLWSLTGLIASADFLLSDVAPEAFGLTDDGRLPPRFVTGEPEPQQLESPVAWRWVAVVATSLGPKGLETLVERVVDRVPAEEGVTYLIITRPPLSEGPSIEKTLLASCSPELRRRIVLAAAGADGVAADFLGAADGVVAASAAEMAVPAIAEAARRSGWILLDGAPRATPAGTFPAKVSARRNAGRAQILTWESAASRLRSTLEDLGGDLGDDDFLVLHAHDRAGPAVRLLVLEDYRGVDVVVWGRPDSKLGQPGLRHLYPYALAVRSAAVPALGRTLEDCETIWDCVCWAVSDEWIDRLRLLVLPGPAESEYWEIREVEGVTTSWSPDTGILPAPRWIPTVAHEPLAVSPEPVFLPRRRFIAPTSGSVRLALETWARRSRWYERMRVVLPWRWGMLERAMKGRW